MTWKFNSESTENVLVSLRKNLTCKVTTFPGSDVPTVHQMLKTPYSCRVWGEHAY